MMLCNIYNSYRGKLVGTYYDSNGNETKALKKVEAKAKLGEKLLKQQEAEEKKYPICNSRWSQQHGGEVRTQIQYIIISLFMHTNWRLYLSTI